jgi:hypothetical protein
MALASLYFDMLTAATAGESYNKAGMIRAAQNGHGGSEAYAGLLIDRSRGSIEAKLMNATAAHQDAIDAGALPKSETMDGYGYRALANYQATLRGAIIVEGHRRAGKWASAEKVEELTA